MKLSKDEKIGIFYTEIVAESVSTNIYISPNAHNERQQDQVLANTCRSSDR